MTRLKLQLTNELNLALSMQEKLLWACLLRVAHNFLGHAVNAPELNHSVQCWEEKAAMQRMKHSDWLKDWGSGTEGKQEVELPSGTVTGEEVGNKGSEVAWVQRPKICSEFVPSACVGNSERQSGKASAVTERCWFVEPAPHYDLEQRVETTHLAGAHVGKSPSV